MLKINVLKMNMFKTNTLSVLLQRCNIKYLLMPLFMVISLRL